MTLVWLIQHLQHVRSEIYRLTVIFIWVDKVKVDLRIGKGRHYRWPVLISWYCYAKSVQLWLDSRPGPGSRCGPASRKWDCAWLVTHDIISTVTSSTDNNNSAQSKYHGDHQHPAQFEFMTLIINKARYGGRILKEQMKNMLPFRDHYSFHSPGPCVVCSECYRSYTWLGINVTMSRGFDNILHEQTLTERGEAVTGAKWDIMSR